MSILYDLLVQAMPILVGITFMLTINAMKIGKSRIKIRSSPEAAGDATGETSASQSDGQETGAESCGFEKEACDRLIESGCMRGENFDSNVRKLAFDRLGIIECGRLNDLGDLAKRNHCARLSVFIRDRKELLRHVLHFGPGSGVLLSYLANYKVEVFSA